MATIAERPLSAEPAVPAQAAFPPNAAPLGLMGFGATTLMLSLINANLLAGADVPVVLSLAIAFGGFVQLLAGMWEFRAGNAFASIAFSSYGAFWISYFVLVQFEAGKLATATAGNAIGAYLWIWGLVTLIFTLCTFKAPRTLTLLFVLLTLTYIFLAIGADGGSSSMTHIGGWLGILTAVNAFYLVLAFLSEGVYGKSMVPLLPAE